ncbi:MAG: hypothetical protein CMJ34_00955 [Phycisphaerae bacterium]|nr:hypothetical protein [Phycisphaerae bacterium]
MSVQSSSTINHRLGTENRGFSITELLVVIGIIVLLIGILLPALGRVRQKARVTETSSVMEEFAKACDAFNQQFGYYPGIVPEEYLANDPKITPMENAVLHLAGGAVRQDELPVFIDGVAYDNLAQIEFEPGNPDSTGQIISFAGPNGSIFRIAVYAPAVGDGPFIQGKRYAPFFSPKGEQFRPAKYNLGEEGTLGEIEFIPTVVDAWGQPVLYARRLRSNGPLVGSDAFNSQFSYESQARTLGASSLGDFGQDQNQFSILNRAMGGTDGRRDTFAQILRTPAIGSAQQPQSGAPRGEYILISPGPDGVYFNIADGPGSPGDAVLNIINNPSKPEVNTPTVVNEYDDIIVSGGG